LSNYKRAALLMSVLLVMFAAGCKKKVVAAPPPPPPPPPVVTPPPPPKAATVASFTVEPSSIQRGQAATLRWSVSDATSITIEPGLGTVQAEGNRQVFPSNTTSYRLACRIGDHRRFLRLRQQRPPRGCSKCADPGLQRPQSDLARFLERHGCHRRPLR
jgi:hypothetical protein